MEDEVESREIFIRLGVHAQSCRSVKISEDPLTRNFVPSQTVGDCDSFYSQ